jgi:dTDP-4-amino-4,6-dideoxygalactose transaminase
VLYTGADVRFADIVGPHDLNLSPHSIERQITPRTRAIIVVHYGGYPCRMPEILEIAQRRGLKVIEDAAHAPGSWLEGRHLGTWGDIGCFSFFSNKNLSTGEGGMLVTNRDDLAEQARLLRSHGMTSLTWDRHQGHAYSYDVVALGYNYRIDEIRSALGLAQLSKLESNNRRRREITCRYWSLLSKSGFTLPFANRIPGQQMDLEGKQYLPSHHLMPVLLPQGINRHMMMECMRDAGIQTSIHYPPIHCFSYYFKRYAGRDSASLTQTEEISSRQITLPLYPGMSEEQVDYVASTALAVLKQSSRRNRENTHGKPTFIK